MQTEEKQDPKAPFLNPVSILCPVKTRRRAGLSFSKGWTDFPAGHFTHGQMAAIQADNVLRVRVLPAETKPEIADDKKPAAKDAKKPAAKDRK